MLCRIVRRAANTLTRTGESGDAAVALPERMPPTRAGNARNIGFRAAGARVRLRDARTQVIFRGLIGSAVRG